MGHTRECCCLTDENEEESEIRKMFRKALRETFKIMVEDILRKERDEEMFAKKASRGSHMNIIASENARRMKRHPR
jgi:hypothetical protein